MDRPPHDPLFEKVPSWVKGPKNELLERRIADMKGKSSTQDDKQPVVINNHTHFPPNFGNPLAQTPFIPGVAVPGLSASSATLVPSGKEPGPKLSITEFCQQFDLGEAIAIKLSENEFASTHSFVLTSVQDLKDIGMKIGAIHELRSAVALWARASEGN